MPASFPSAPKSFTPVNTGDLIVPPMWTDGYDEIQAIEQSLLGGLSYNLVPDSSGNNRMLGSPASYWGILYAKVLALATATELTIAGGVVTGNQGYHSIDTEGNAAADDLDSIVAGPLLIEGVVLVLRAADPGRVVTARTGTGNLRLHSDAVIGGNSTLTLIYDGLNWRELARSGGTGTGDPGPTPTPSISSAQYSCSAYHNAVIQLTINVDTPIPFNTNDFSHGALHDPTTNNTRFVNTTTLTSRFLCTGQVFHKANSGGSRTLWLRKNGTTAVSGQNEIPGSGTSGVSEGCALSAIVELAPNDYVEWISRQNVGSTNESGHATIRQLMNSAQMTVLA
jgi:hypothetical protein